MPFASLLYDVGFDPDLSFAAAMGGLINQGGPTFNSTGYFSALGPWEVRLMIRSNRVFSACLLIARSLVIFLDLLAAMV